MVVAQNTTIPVPVNVGVGVVLDFDKQLGKIGLSCINMALSDFYATHGFYRTRLVLNPRDSKIDIIGAAAAGTCFLFHPSFIFVWKKRKKNWRFEDRNVFGDMHIYMLII